MSHSVEEGYKLYNEKRFKESFDALFDAAAYDNNSEAQYFIGLMYHDGEGVEKNIESAMKWWKKATRNGHVHAANRMSEISTGTSVMF
ncbi:tetratricopeptide repeat protein [Sulfurimonas sp.]|uniref:tetratricopeptide repeat protein n=1 Tax=Sulfurimonas sp. TaxID=2022749 RepID=UPI00356A13B5